MRGELKVRAMTVAVVTALVATACAGAAQPAPTAPAVQPTAAPAAKPTAAPAAKPTEAPAAKPTEAPAAKPTEAPKPAAQPTTAPAAPTTAPAAPAAAPAFTLKGKLTEEPLVVWVAGGGISKEAHVQGCLEPFEKDTGVKVQYVEGPADLGYLTAQVKAGQPQFDTMKILSSQMDDAIKDGLIQKLDYGVIDTSKLTPNQYTHKWGDYGIFFDAFGWVMFYRTDKWPDPATAPQSWEDFWNVQKFPGPRGMDGRARQNGAFEAASRAMGVPPDKTYPLDLERIFAKLDEIKPNVTFWYEQGAVQTQAMLRKEVDLILAWTGRGYDAVVQGAPYAIAPKTHIRLIGSPMVVPTGAKHPKNASAAIGYCGTAEAQAVYASKSYYAVTNENAIKFVEPKIKPILGNAPEYKDTTVVMDDNWYTPRQKEVETRWKEWQSR